MTREQLLYHYRHQIRILEARKRVWKEIGQELTRGDANELQSLRRRLGELEKKS